MLTKGGVLLVEDDAGLRKRVATALEEENYEVFVAATGPQATHLADTAPIDILVVDLTRQSDSHWQSVVDLAVNRPHLRTVVICDGLDGSVEANVAGGYAFLGKPLEPGRLVETINELLAERRAETFSQRLHRHQATPGFSRPAVSGG
jgi:DNA-binding NtrC family response regulator